MMFPLLGRVEKTRPNKGFYLVQTLQFEPEYLVV